MTPEHNSPGARDGGSLQRRALQLLMQRRHDQSFTVIAQHTGLTVPWLGSFARQLNSSYSVDRVQRLWEYLTGRELNVD